MPSIWGNPTIAARFVELAQDHALYYLHIAKALSEEFKMKISKNACIGRGRRIGLPPRDIHAPYRQKRKRAVKRKPVHARRTKVKAKAPSHVLLMDLKADHCRYPHGDFAPFLFCGARK